MAKLDPPPQRLQSAYAWCPAIFVPALPIITTAAAAGPRPRSRQKHPAATATATEKFGTGELAVDAFVALERNSLLAVDHDPIGERLDRDREPGAGPAWNLAGVERASHLQGVDVELWVALDQAVIEPAAWGHVNFIPWGWGKGRAKIPI